MSLSTPPPPVWFSPGQRRFIAMALTGLAGVALGGVLFLVVWVLGRFLAAFGHILSPLALAAILSMLLRPVVNRIEIRLKLSRFRAIILLYFLVVAICIAFGLLLLPLLASQLIELTHTVPEFSKTAFVHLKDKLRDYPDIYQSLKTYLDEESLKNRVADATQRALTLLLSAPSTLGKVFEFAAAVAVIPVYLFYLLETNRDFTRDYHDQLMFLPASLRNDIVFLTNEFASIMVSFFHGRLLIGLIMGGLQAAGLLLIGLQGGFVLGLFFGLLCLMPFLGAILGFAVILPMAYFQPGGSVSLLLEAGGILVVAQILDAYYLTPIILGRHTGLHPMVIILSIFFWSQALHGILGILLAVPLTAFFVIFWRLLKTKYLPRHSSLTQPGFKIS
jgi:predicted PurR-regulated permease PerM